MLRLLCTLLAIFWREPLTLMTDVQALQHNVFSFKLVVSQSALTCCRLSLRWLRGSHFSQLKQRQPVYMDRVEPVCVGF